MVKLKQIRVDGYKNLIGAVLDLGDFNILVGPNNSGKSNLLEAIQMLWAICFGDDKLRQHIFAGLTPPPRSGSSVCRLEKHRDKPLTIGVVFELTVGDQLWKVDYEVKIQCIPSYRKEQKTKAGFVSEQLEAKNPSATGPARTYISRDEKVLKIPGKAPHLIARENSSLLAIRSIYPDFQDLPSELKAFVEAIEMMADANVIALSPENLRENINTERRIRGLHVSSFDLLLAIDDIQKQGKYYEIFKETVCDILDLEKVHFEVKNIHGPSKEDEPKEKLKRIRFLFIKRRGTDYSFVNEYSDGTFVVTSTLAAMLSEKMRSPIMYVEELENYLHPSAIKKLLSFLQDHADKWPVLITTHSPYLLNCVKNPEDVSVAVVDETGAAHFEKVRNTKQLRDYLKSGFMSFGDMLASNFEDVLRE
ncbi:MAG: AAA family ATPase [Planctomycetota bacterium]|nr:AAA family ATPase [Planctomycetota bacterium]